VALRAVALAAALAGWLGGWTAVAGDPPPAVRYVEIAGDPAAVTSRLARAVPGGPRERITVVELRVGGGPAVGATGELRPALRVLARARGPVVVYVPVPAFALSPYELDLLAAADLAAIAPTRVSPVPFSRAASAADAVGVITALAREDLLQKLDGRRLRGGRTLRTAGARVEDRAGRTLAPGERVASPWLIAPAALAGAVLILLAATLALPASAALALAGGGLGLAAGMDVAVAVMVAAQGAALALGARVSDGRLLALAAVSIALAVAIALLGQPPLGVLAMGVGAGLVAGVSVEAPGRRAPARERDAGEVAPLEPVERASVPAPVYTSGPPAPVYTSGPPASGPPARPAPEPVAARVPSPPPRPARSANGGGATDAGARSRPADSGPQGRAPGPQRPQIVLGAPARKEDDRPGNLWSAATVGHPSRAARAVPKLPAAEPALHDTVVDYAAVGDLQIRAASVRGARHRVGRTPRQDAYGLAATPDGRFVVAAVADGVSGAPDSHIGAHWAVTHGTQIAVDRLSVSADVDGLDAAELGAEIAAAVASSAHDSLLRAGREVELADVGDQVATTLVVAVVPVDATHGRRVWFARVGDSSACLLGDGGWRRVFTEPSSAATPALPASFAHVEQATVHAEPGEAVLLMTDGIDKPLGSGRGEVGRYLSEHWCRAPDPLEFVRQAQFERKTFDDDRTAVGLWPPPRPAAEEPDGGFAREDEPRAPRRALARVGIAR
jgi:hypothetical protein